MAERGLRSRQALADYLGFARTTVHYWLTGQREPDDLSIAVIAQRFGVSRARIYELLGRMAPLDDAEYREVVELYEQANPQEREDILDYMRYRIQRQKRRQTSAAPTAEPDA